MIFFLIFLESRFVQGQAPIGKIVMKRTMDQHCLSKEGRAKRPGTPYVNNIHFSECLFDYNAMISKSTNSTNICFFCRHTLVGINLGLCGHIPSGQMPEMYTSLLYLGVNAWVRDMSSPYREDSLGDRSFCHDITNENPPEGGAVSI